MRAMKRYIFFIYLQCEAIIESCQKKAEDLIKDLDLHILVHKAFGTYAFNLINLSINKKEKKGTIFKCQIYLASRVRKLGTL